MSSSLNVNAIEISRVSTDDAKMAFAFVEEYFEAIGVVAREDSREFFAEYFGNGRGFWLARVERVLAGCVGLRKLKCPDAGENDRLKCAEIKRMYVREKFRGQGIAQKLLEGAERFASDAGYGWIYLDTTDEMKAAAQLYERNGYQRCERYNDNPQATIFMKKNLQAVC